MTTIGCLTYLTPPLAVFLTALIRGEAVTAQAVWGLALILAAAVLGRRVG